MKTRWEQDKAAHSVEFFERLLVHTKGAYARQPFILAPFQRHIVGSLFGWHFYDTDYREWVRLFTVGWLEMARGSGKSELLAGLALKLTGADDEEGAEVYGVAKDTDQASLVFNVARRMLELAELGGRPRDGLPFVLYPTNKRIVYPKTGSFYRVIAADALGNLGQDPHGIVFDEIIAQPDGELWDAMKTGFKRKQPLMVAATTAGAQPSSFAKIEHDFSLRVAERPDLAPRRFVFATSVPRDADISDESVWPRSSPAYGDFLRPQTYRDEYHEAFGKDGNIRAQRAFRQYRMNQWLDSPVEGWDGAEDWPNGAQSVVLAKLKATPVWVGLVCASTTDLSSIALVHRNPEGAGWWCHWRWFLPADSLSSLDRRTDGHASVWRKNGQLELTEGNVIDVARHAAVVREIAKNYDLRELVYDPNGAVGVISPLMEDFEDRLEPVFSTNPASALLDWERLLKSGEFNHGGDSIAGWQLSHLRVKESLTKVIKIDRKNSTDNVFGIAAAELALRRALIAEEPVGSAYSDHDAIIV